MKFDDLEKAELIPYNPQDYAFIRRHFDARCAQLATNPVSNKILIENYNMAIHLSYCVQNLHKQFIPKLMDLLDYYNKHNGSLPSEIYFEPTRPKVFPPPPKMDDDLPNLNKILMHHANLYSMKTMPLTWAALVKQYVESLNFSISKSLLDDCVNAGTDGCFDKCISDMGEWKVMLESAAEKTQKYIC